MERSDITLQAIADEILSEKDTDKIVIRVARTKKSIPLPLRATSCSAGVDLTSSENVTIEPNKKVIIDTGLRFELPPGYFGFVAGRSGLAMRNNIFVFHGIIDQDYRGPVKVCLYNLCGDKEYEVKIGERIAQLVLLPTCYASIRECQLDENSERGHNGFGSSGQF